jgi:hypothetical protein
VWGYIFFIDLRGIKRRARNEGDYKLGIVASVFFWSQESILARLEPPFIHNWEGTHYLPLFSPWMWGLNLYDGLAYLLSSLESMCSTREIIIVLHLVPSDSFEGVHLDRIITSYPWHPICRTWCTVSRGYVPGYRLRSNSLKYRHTHDVVACCHLNVHCQPITRVGHHER